MNSRRILGVILLFLGVLFFLEGLNATDSLTEEVSEGLTGRYTDQTTWFLLSGLAMTLVGGALAFVGGGEKPRSA